MEKKSIEKTDNALTDVQTAVKTKVPEGKKMPFSLPAGKVLVKPVIRGGEWLPKGHSGSFMYTNTKMRIVLPLDKNTGSLTNPLTKEEQEFFESPRSGLDFKPGDLSVYKKENNFWHTFKVEFSKVNDTADENTVLLELSLSDAMDYLKYKVLNSYTKVTGGMVAPSWDERYNSGTYRIALVKENEEYVTRSVKVSNKMTAYGFLDKIKNSPTNMYEIMYIYYLESKRAGKPSKDSTREWYMTEISKIIENDLDGFLKVIENKDTLELKRLILKGLQHDAIVYVRGKFELPEGKPIGNNINEAVKYFLDERHQEDYVRLKGLLE